MSYYYNGITSKKVLSVVQVKEVEVDYFVGCATYDTTKQDSFIVPNYISVNGANFPILDNTKTSVFEIGGNSQAFNQIAYGNLKSSNNIGGNAITTPNDFFKSISYSDNGIEFTCSSFTGRYNLGFAIVQNSNQSYYAIISSHKYLFRVKAKASVSNIINIKFQLPGGLSNNFNLTTEWQTFSAILTANTTNASSYLYFGNIADIVEDMKVNLKEWDIFDLTLMGLEDITIEQFNALFPLDYYPYNEGEIFSTAPSKIESYSTENVKLGQINIPQYQGETIVLNGLGDKHDLLTFVEQEDGTYNAILTRNIGVVDLGSLSWGTSQTYGYYSSGLRTLAKIPANNNIRANIQCAIFVSKPRTDTSFSSFGNNTIALDYGGDLDISYTQGLTPNEFKLAMDGVMFYYELATPTTETIATGLTFDQVATLFEKGGTIQLGNSNSDYVQCDLSMAFAIRRFRSEVQ